MTIPIGSEVFRKYEIPGVPTSGPHQPDKAEIIALLTFYETMFGGGEPESSVIRLTVTGGTANAIVATASIETDVPGNKIYILTPTANNTGAVTVNGIPVKTALGSDLVTGSLLNDAPVILIFSVDHYQLIVSVPVDATGVLNDVIAARDAANGFSVAAASSASALGNQVHQYDTRAQAIAATIPVGVQAIKITRFATGYPLAYATYIPGTSAGPMAFAEAGGHFWELDISGGVVNPLWFGAKGDQTTDDSAALQAAATAAVSVGGELLLPMMFKSLTAISILGHVSVRGVGFQTSPINYGFGATQFNFDTRSTGFKGSGLICGVANSAFSVATTDSVSFQNLHVTYPTVGNSGVAAFLLNTASGNVGVNLNSVIRDVLINNANVGIKVTDWLQYEFDNIYFVANTNPIIAENLTSVNFTGVPTSASCGDSKIKGCTFLITQGSAAIQLLSGSGYRIANCKFNGSNSGLSNTTAILVSPQDLGVPFSMVPGIIADNSIEGFANGIFFTPNASSQGTLGIWSIVGNEFFCTTGISMSSGIAIPQWMAGIVISGNSFTYGQNSTAPCIGIAGVNGAVVGDNVFGGGANSAGAAIFIGTNVSNLKIGNNIYTGTAQAPNALTPTVPATGIAATNNTGYTVTVNIFGGTVGSVTVNLSGFGGATVSQSTNCSVLLNPGDQIVLTYSAAPDWIWRAANP